MESAVNIKKYITLFAFVAAGTVQAATTWDFHAIQGQDLPAGTKITINFMCNNEVAESGEIQPGKNFNTTKSCLPEEATAEYIINGQRTIIGKDMARNHNYNIFGINKFQARTKK